MRETVGIVRCPDYQENHLREAVTRLLEMLRLDRISRPDTLLFKPNMLSARRPEEGVTTHPGVLKVLGEALAGRILIGDSPANTARPIEEYWDTCGLTAVAASLKASLVKFEEPVFLSLKVRKKNVKIPVAAISRKIPMVNLPKLKTHGLTVITAATKNLYGCIPGYQKSLLHRLFLSPQDFSYLLIELYRMLRDNIFFHLVDAITIMDGNGPSAGRLRGPGYLIAGRDALAVDIVCGKLLGLKAAEIPFLKLYDEIYGLPKVDLLGDRLLPLSDVALPGLSVSSSLLKLP
ncbi:MAG TPA: DUF362 domain-containing protein, partial [bacterium]|nr:DUF362 domain-containing protein [bacterium]